MNYVPQAPQPPQMIRISGWFCRTGQYPEKLSLTNLDERLYKYSTKDYRLDSLEILPIERYVGPFLYPVKVQAVTDTSQGVTAAPFFIEKSKVSKLRKLLKTVSIINL